MAIIFKYFGVCDRVSKSIPCGKMKCFELATDYYKNSKKSYEYIRKSQKYRPELEHSKVKKQNIYDTIQEKVQYVMWHQNFVFLVKNIIVFKIWKSGLK